MKNELERDDQVEVNGQGTQMSRRKLLASLGMVGAAAATTGLLQSVGLGTAYAKDHETTVSGAVYGGVDVGPDHWKDLLGLPYCLTTTVTELRLTANPVAGYGYYVIDKGQEGLFLYDPTDAASPDNTGTVLVSANGKRFKRRYGGDVLAQWFDAKFDGVVDDTSVHNAAMAWLSTAGGGVYRLPDHAVTGVRGLQVPPNVHLKGGGYGTILRFLPSGSDAADSTAWAVNWVGSGGSLQELAIDGQFTAGSSSRRVGNGLRIVADSKGLKRYIRNVRITGFSGYNAVAVGGTFGVSRNFARADITDDAGNHLLTGGNGVKCDTSGGAAAWELHVDGLIVDTVDGIGCDWSNITDSTFNNVIVGNCVFRGWVETGANNHRHNIKVYRSMMLNCRDDFNTSINKIIPHQATASADNGGAVLLAGQRLIGEMESQENGAHAFCAGTNTQPLQLPSLRLIADGNGGIDGSADAATNDNYRRYGLFLRAYYGGQIDIVCDDFRARFGYPRQLRGIHVVSAAGRYQINKNGSVVAAAFYRIKANVGGADFTPLQIGIATPSNAVGTVFPARQIFNAPFPPAGTTFGAGGVLEPANDNLQVRAIIANQYEQDHGTGPGYSISGDNGKSFFFINGALIVNSLTVAPLLNTENALQVAVKGEAASRLAIQGSKVKFGDGTTTPTAAIDYLGINKIGTPSSVTFRSGGGAYNGGHAAIGTNEKWVDAFGMERVKSGAPSSDTDGFPMGKKVAVPSSATASGAPGQWAADTSFFYSYTGDGTTHSWRRVAIASW